jgi:hypothetical protein
VPRSHSREDLICSRSGEIGLGLLVIAHGFRKGEYSVASRVLVRNLIQDMEKLIVRLESLDDPTVYESELCGYLRKCQKDLSQLGEEAAKAQLPAKPALPKTRESWHGGHEPPLEVGTGVFHVFMDPEASLREEEGHSQGVWTAMQQIADRLESDGKFLYEDWFNFRPDSSKWSETADELERLSESVQTYGPASPIVTIHAKWIAGDISALLNPDSPSRPHDWPNSLRDRALAAKTFLEEIHRHDQSECEDYLSRIVLMLRGLKPNQLPGATAKQRQIKKRPNGHQESSPVTPKPAVEEGDDEIAYPPKKLAEMYHVPAEALRKRLERRRSKDDGCYVEVEAPTRQEARYLYRLGRVRHIIEDLKKSSNSRPTEEK